MSMLLYGSMSCLLGALGAWFVASFGDALGLLDYPGERSSHQVITPKGGGIGILAAFVSVSLLAGVAVMLWLPASTVAIVGLYGDKKHLSPRLRLVVQFGSALGFLFGISPEIPPTMKNLLGCLLACIFIVGTANFYNFMDGINGIAAITGAVGFGLLALFAYTSGADASFLLLTTCLALACAGFLPFNIPKAHVFMGDVGSILLGFVFAGLVLLLSNTLTVFLCLTACLFPFYADELTTMAVRVRLRENLLQPHRRHLYQLLVNELGMPHWKISLGYGVIQLFFGIHFFSIRQAAVSSIVLVLFLYFAGFSAISWIVRRKVGSKPSPQ